MNFSGTFNALRVLYSPSLFLPQTVIPNFGKLPVPIPPGPSNKPVRVVVLDKDNCFAEPHSDEVWPDYKEKWQQLRKQYPGNQLLIVSNTAGSKDDSGNNQARALERNTGVKVFHHSLKKPGCHSEILSYVRAQELVESPDEIAVIGDRLMTDVLMANLMHARSVWVRDGVIPSQNPLVRLEKSFYDFMSK